MATTSQVKSGLDAISGVIAEATQARTNAKALLLRSRSLLADLPTTYSDVISTVDGYTPTGAYETLAKDEKAKLAAEFVALKTAIEAELTALSVSF